LTTGLLASSLAVQVTCRVVAGATVDLDAGCS